MSRASAIIIAAGLGSRLRPLTDHMPKCMLEVGEKSLLSHNIDNLQKNGIDNISIVTGYKADKIHLDGLNYYHNNNYHNNNILHSLLYAREALEQAIEDKTSVIISYSDIWYHSSIVECLLRSQSDINIVVDSHWKSAYEGRTEHPISEAELAIFNQDNQLCKIGKNVIEKQNYKKMNGEFIGLLMMRPAGINSFLNHFDKLNKTLTLTCPFQKAAEWQKSYITDILQDMIENQVVIDCLCIKGKWKEFDTVQDFERGLPAL